MIKYYTIKPADSHLPLVRVETKEEAIKEIERVKALTKWPNVINIFRYETKLDAFGREVLVSKGGL